jgi:hypothetical protein
MAIPQAQLDNWFRYHTPTLGQVQVYADLRSKAKEFAELFNAVAPDCADKTAALRMLRNTVMAMNLAIACNHETEPTDTPQKEGQ